MPWPSNVDPSLPSELLYFVLDRLPLVIGEFGFEKLTQEGQALGDPLVAVDHAVTHTSIVPTPARGLLQREVRVRNLRMRQGR